MFFIFGWNRQDNEFIGTVEECQCSNCHNVRQWYLEKFTKWFTLFFIPVIPYSSSYWLYCPVCNFGYKLSNDMVEEYKEIARINKQFLAGTISEDEKLSQLENIHKSIGIKSEEKQKLLEQESQNFREKVSVKTSNELEEILARPDDYSPAFLIAVKEELKKRN